MKLHDDKEVFRQIILLTAEGSGIDPGIIEKDYYVTEFLKLLVQKQPKVIFKGGTSLSKCYKLIKRFSEDIDLNLECDVRPTEGQRRHLKADIISTIDGLGFELINAGDVRSRRYYNKYIIDFPSVFETAVLKQNLIVETSVFIRSYPNSPMQVTSYVYDYLKKEQRDDIINEFSLEPYEVKVQSIERTFIDKLFAIGDYYLSGKVIEHSRHIYDLHKMIDNVRINESLTNLFVLVRRERSRHTACFSAQENVDLREVLQKIISQNVYKNDYELITEGLLFEKVTYKTAIRTLQKIVDSDLLQE